MNQPYIKATIYLCSDYGYERIEATFVKHWLTPHAQYTNAIGLEYTLKGAQSAKRVGVTEPLIILAGWGHPEQEVWINDAENPSFDTTRFQLFSDEWKVEFDKFLQDYTSVNPQVEVLADYRDHQFETSPSNVDDDDDPFADVSGGPDYDMAFEQKPREEIERDLLEGEAKEVTLTIYERNPIARKQCIQHYGCACFICGFDFQVAYGDVGRDFVHVHHLIPLSEIGESYSVDPIEDLRPVCANCHNIIHRRTPPYNMDEMAGFIRKPQNV